MAQATEADAIALEKWLHVGSLAYTPRLIEEWLRAGGCKLLCDCGLKLKAETFIGKMNARIEQLRRVALQFDCFSN